MPYLGLIGELTGRSAAPLRLRALLLLLDVPEPAMPVPAFWDLVVRREAAHETERYGFLREHALHRLAGRAAPEAHVADP